MPPGDYHVSIDTVDCVIWYDFTILDLSAGAIYGCVDPIACNYDSAATIDDGSCTYSGCMDPLATNYNPLAGCDDGSCHLACTNYPLTGAYVDNVVVGGFDFHYDNMNGGPCQGLNNCWQDCCVHWIKVIWTECESSPPHNHVNTALAPTSITSVPLKIGGGNTSQFVSPGGSASNTASSASCWGGHSCNNNNCQQGFTNCEDSGCTGGTCTQTISNIQTGGSFGLHPGLTYHIQAQVKYACYPSPTLLAPSSTSHVGYITMPGTDPLTCNVHYPSSDRRLKKNINKIGESPSGLNIYSFEYKNSKYGEGLFQGVMSDEIPQEAVGTRGGYDTVNYSMLDVEFKQI
jgi:hypothetical protein